MKGEYIAGILCCRGGRSSSQASCYSSLLGYDDTASDTHPPAYARYVKI